MKFYTGNVYVISRVNWVRETWSRAEGRYVPRHWVLRFLQSSNGVVGDQSNTELVLHRTGSGGKGEAAERFHLTHFVDDSIDCLWSILKDPVGNAWPWIVGCPDGGGCILMCNDRVRRIQELRQHFESMVDRYYSGVDADCLHHWARPAQTWRSVLDLLDLRVPLGAFKWFGPSFKSLFFFGSTHFDSSKFDLLAGCL